MAEADILTAIAEILTADGNVAGLAGARVFAGELPANEAGHMPRNAVVILPSGGVSLAAGSFLDHDTQRIDLFSYGATPFEAEALRRLCRRALVRVRRRIVRNCLIHWIEPAGGFTAGRDPDADWPRAFQSYQVFHALQEV
ncbi:DUF3168 domain-containing protein [Sinorhizobium medicae]|uniref:DUF3168 domain-containing protein n=1 Tax=Sinorhizobium medicae TaxID=110321 RepID=UPI0004053DB8|nr:DUF3168 domain-containing protein [Sinorhizobium medicae]RVQ76116.1 DUF3168 domain-containing protein [Sinorhizobium medicae]